MSLGTGHIFSFSGEGHKTVTKKAKAFPSAACNGCHLVSAADDFVFTQFYPVLRAGKGTGKNATGGHVDDLNNSYVEPGAK